MTNLFGRYQDISEEVLLGPIN